MKARSARWERKVSQGMPTREELVTRCAHQVQVTQDLVDQMEGRVDPDRAGPRVAEAAPGLHADLEIGPWLH